MMPAVGFLKHARFMLRLNGSFLSTYVCFIVAFFSLSLSISMHSVVVLLMIIGCISLVYCFYLLVLCDGNENRSLLLSVFRKNLFVDEGVVWTERANAMYDACTDMYDALRFVVQDKLNSRKPTKWVLLTDNRSGGGSEGTDKHRQMLWLESYRTQWKRKMLSTTTTTKAV